VPVVVVPVALGSPRPVWEEGDAGIKGYNYQNK